MSLKRLPFVQYNTPIGAEILYRPTFPVGNILDDKIQRIIVDMKDKMSGNGIGLAANQIGESIQVFMIEFEKKSDRYSYLDLPSVPFQVFVNPVITAASDVKKCFWHGCLSALDHPRGLVATYDWIDYEAYDENGQFKSGRLDGMAAVIFQHEFRHLLGSLYLDHAKEFKEKDALTALFECGELQAYTIAGEDVPLLLSDYTIGDPIFK